MADTECETVVEGLAFPTSPRWHGGWLWFSDTHDRQVLRMAKNGYVQVIINVPGRPGGLGWSPDGDMQIVSMTDQKLLRVENGRLVEVAALSEFVTSDCTDMSIHPDSGRSYIGNFGFDIEAGEDPKPTTIVCVEPGGEAWVVVENAHLPNGSTITPDGRTFIIAESAAQRLSAYTIEDDGSLSNPRVWADLSPNVPVDVCLDEAGGAWVADPVNAGVMRVLEGSGTVSWIPASQGVYGCELGGEDGKTLFMCTAASSNPAQTVEHRAGKIESMNVDVPRAAAAT